MQPTPKERKTYKTSSLGALKYQENVLEILKII